MPKAKKSERCLVQLSTPHSYLPCPYPISRILEMVGGGRVGISQTKFNYLHSTPRQYRPQQFGSGCYHCQSKPPRGPHRWKSSGMYHPRQHYDHCMAYKLADFLRKWHTIAKTHHPRFRASFRDLDHSVQPCRMDRGCIA